VIVYGGGVWSRMIKQRLRFIRTPTSCYNLLWILYKTVMMNRRNFLSAVVAGVITVCFPSFARAKVSTPDWMARIKLLDGRSLTVDIYYNEVCPEGLCLDFSKIDYSELEYVDQMFRDFVARNPGPPPNIDITEADVLRMCPNKTPEEVQEFILGYRKRYKPHLCPSA